MLQILPTLYLLEMCKYVGEKKTSSILKPVLNARLHSSSSNGKICMNMSKRKKKKTTKEFGVELDPKASTSHF